MFISFEGLDGSGKTTQAEHLRVRLEADGVEIVATRAQHVEEVIRPALERGATVICDRYVDSSVVYQGVARGLGLERVFDLNLAAVGGLMPDHTFLLQLDPADVPG